MRTCTVDGCNKHKCEKILYTSKRTRRDKNEINVDNEEIVEVITNVIYESENINSICSLVNMLKRYCMKINKDT